MSIVDDIRDYLHERKMEKEYIREAVERKMEYEARKTEDLNKLDSIFQKLEKWGVTADYKEGIIKSNPRYLHDLVGSLTDLVKVLESGQMKTINLKELKELIVMFDLLDHYKPESFLTPKKLHELAICVDEGVNIESIINTPFDIDDKDIAELRNRLLEVKNAKEEGIDISKYTKVYAPKELTQIKMCIEHGIDPSSFLNYKKMDAEEIKNIRNCIESGISGEQLNKLLDASENFSTEEYKVIAEYAKKGIDLSRYFYYEKEEKSEQDPLLTNTNRYYRNAYELEEIAKGLENNIDVSFYAKNYYTIDEKVLNDREMDIARFFLEQNVPSDQVNQIISRANDYYFIANLKKVSSIGIDVKPFLNMSGNEILMYVTLSEALNNYVPDQTESIQKEQNNSQDNAYDMDDVGTDDIGDDDFDPADEE